MSTQMHVAILRSYRRGLRVRAEFRAVAKYARKLPNYKTSPKNARRAARLILASKVKA